MADDLPPGFTLDAPAAGKGSDVPEGFKLDTTPEEASQARESELRKKYRGEIFSRGEPGYGERFIDSATWGLSRPLSGVVRGIQGLGDENSSFGERYRAGVGAAKDYFQKGEENTAGAGGVVTDIAGALAAPIPLGKVAQAGTAAADVARGALGRIIAQGATQGGIEGAARNSEDVGSAVKGGLTGAAVGGATSAAVGGALNLIPGVRGAVKGAEKEASKAAAGAAPEELKAAAKTGFQALDNAGVGYAGVQGNTLKQGIDDLIATNQYNNIAHSKISGYVDELLQKAQQPQGMKFTELSNLREALSKEARGNDASTRGAAQKVIAEIDKMVEQNAPAINPQGMDVKGVYEKARSLWRSAALADDVNWAATKAERKAALKSGTNPDLANREAFATIRNKIDKPGAYSPYGPPGSEQRQLLARIVEGDKLQNTYRNIGTVTGSPTTRALLAAGAGLAGFHGGLGPVVGALGGGAAVGGGVKGALDRAAAGRGTENINALIRSITGSQARVPSEMAQRILLAKELAKRVGGQYAGSKIDVQPERLRVTRDEKNIR